LALGEVTRILADIKRGNRQAARQLLPLVFDELRRLAAACGDDDAHRCRVEGLLAAVASEVLGPDDTAGAQSVDQITTTADRRSGSLDPACPPEPPSATSATTRSAASWAAAAWESFTRPARFRSTDPSP
jgi:hypothetical protein